MTTTIAADLKSLLYNMTKLLQISSIPGNDLFDFAKASDTALRSGGAIFDNISAIFSATKSGGTLYDDVVAVYNALKSGGTVYDDVVAIYDATKSGGILYDWIETMQATIASLPGTWDWPSAAQWSTIYTSLLSGGDIFDSIASVLSIVLDGSHGNAALKTLIDAIKIRNETAATGLTDTTTSGSTLASAPAIGGASKFSYYWDQQVLTSIIDSFKPLVSWNFVDVSFSSPFLKPLENAVNFIINKILHPMWSSIETMVVNRITRFLVVLGVIVDKLFSAYKTFVETNFSDFAGWLFNLINIYITSNLDLGSMKSLFENLFDQIGDNIPAFNNKNKSLSYFLFKIKMKFLRFIGRRGHI